MGAVPPGGGDCGGATCTHMALHSPLYNASLYNACIEEASTWSGLVSSLLGGGGGGNGTRLAGGADGRTGATGWASLSAAVALLVAAAALVLRGCHRPRDTPGRGAEEEKQGFLSLGLAEGPGAAVEGAVHCSEREGGKLLGDGAHSRMDLRF